MQGSAKTMASSVPVLLRSEATIGIRLQIPSIAWFLLPTLAPTRCMQVAPGTRAQLLPARVGDG